MAGVLETPKENPKKPVLAKQSGKFWQHDCIRQLLSQIAVSFFLILCTFGGVFYSSSLWENSLFPGLQKIDPLQRDLTILQAKVDQLTQTVNSITDRGTEIEALKTHLLTLQNALAIIEKGGTKTAEIQPQMGSELIISQISLEFKSTWEQLKTRLQQGEVCTDVLGEFKNKLPANCGLEAQLPRIEGFSQTPAKPMTFLYEQLDKIYQTVKVSPLANEKVMVPDTQSWWAVIWKYLSKWIQIRSLENKGEQVSVTAAFEKALQALKNNQLNHTIECLKSLPSIEAVQEWLSQAEQRLLCNGIISEVDKLVAQSVKG